MLSKFFPRAGKMNFFTGFMFLVLAVASVVSAGNVENNSLDWLLQLYNPHTLGNFSVHEGNITSECTGNMNEYLGALNEEKLWAAKSKCPKYRKSSSNWNRWHSTHYKAQIILCKRWCRDSIRLIDLTRDRKYSITFYLKIKPLCCSLSQPLS